MTSRDLSNVEVLPPGTPLLGLVQGQLVLRFVVLVEGAMAAPERGRSFVALVIKPWLVIPLAYRDTFDEALEALRLVLSGFLEAGFVVKTLEIGKEEK